MSKLIVAGAAAVALMAVVVASASGGSQRADGPSGASRRSKVDGILGEVVPCVYPDSRFQKMDPNWSPADDYTTCISLVHYYGMRLGLRYGINSGGTEALRSNGKEFGAWVLPGGGRVPRHGDVFGLEYVGGPAWIIHVGVFLDSSNGGRTWHTADGGQGGKGAQGAKFMTRDFDASKSLVGGPAGWRKLAGWVDIGLYPAATGGPQHSLVNVEKIPWEGEN